MISKNDIIKVAKGLIKEKNYAEAEKVLIEALEEESDSFLMGMLADLYIKTGRLAEAEDLIESILKSEPGNRYTLQKKGDILAKKGDLKGALLIFADMFKRGDDSYYLMKRLARVHYLMNDLNEALDLALKAAKKYSDRHDIHYMLYQIYRKMDNKSEAAEAIGRAIEIDPGNKFYYKEKLSLRMDEKDLDSSSIEDMIEITEEENPHLLKLLGDKLKKEGNLERAIEVYKKLLSLEDSDFNRKSLAFLLYKNKEYSGAFKLFMSLQDSNFMDNIFLSTITAAAKTAEEKSGLVERMVRLAQSSGQYKNLWGKIKKVNKEIGNEEDK